jgi:hypothetical protein
MIAIIFGILFAATSIVLLTGHGFTGYGTFSMGMPEKEKREYDTKSLCRYIGKIILPISILTFFLGIEAIIKWYVWVYTSTCIGLSIFAIVHVSKGDRYRK